MEFGARAQMINLRTWYNRGLNTLTKLITVYAPPNENDTANYISFLSKRLSLDPDYPFSLTPGLLVQLAYAISIMENGTTSYITPDLYSNAYKLI
jgi:hypothetical protein